MKKPPIPKVFRDLGAKPGAIQCLLVAAVSMGAAGLNPPVASPALPNMQAAIRAQPELNALVLLATLTAAALLFLGGILGDTDGRRGLLLGALGVLGAANLFGLLDASSPLFVVSRLAAAAAAYAVLPFALALVATTYQGVSRATAIGVVYAAYGAGTAVGPALLTVLGPAGPPWPAFLAASIAAALALRFVWSRAPNLDAIARSDPGYVVATAVWAFAIIVITCTAIGIGNRDADAFRVGLLIVGLVMIGGYVAWDRRRRHRPEVPFLRVEKRPVAVAVGVGVVVSFAQAAPLFQLPLFFYLILQYGAIGASLATLPFVVALVVAGPVAGAMLTRFRPRTLVAVGLAAVGLGNVIAAVVLGRDVPYLALALSLVFIGAGFVIATTVRTAIVFASVSRGLPATAAALNEASLLVGGRIGLAVLTALITQRALDIYAGSLSGMEPAQRDAAVAAFRDVLLAIGTPGISQILGLINPSDAAAYAAALIEAYRASLFGTGLLALVTAPIAWLALGARDPLTTVWDLRDERPEVARSSSA